MKTKINGFTLIELVVVVSVLSILLLTVTGVMVSSFRARGRVEIADKLEQNGSSVLAALRENILRADKESFVCNGDSVSFTNKYDDQMVTLSCIENIDSKIASDSATKTVTLTSSDVVATNCSTFVTCTPSPSITTPVAVIDFKFTLATVPQQSLGVGETLSREFEQKVTVRN